MWCSTNQCLAEVGCFPSCDWRAQSRHANGLLQPPKPAESALAASNVVPPTVIGEKIHDHEDVQESVKSAVAKVHEGRDFDTVVPSAADQTLREVACQDESGGTEEPVTEDQVDNVESHESYEPAPEVTTEHDKVAEGTTAVGAIPSDVHMTWSGMDEQPLADGMEEASLVVPNKWERFLAGDMFCGGCGYAFWLIFILIVVAASAQGMAFSNNQDGWDVLSDATVQEYYVYTYVTSYDNVFTDSRRLRETSSSPKGNRERRLETSVSADRARSSVGDVATIIYEAVGTECPGDDCDLASKSLLNPEYLKAIRAFESSLWGNAVNQESFCQLVYAQANTSSTARCSPPTSYLQLLYFHGESSIAATESLLEEGFGDPVKACLCGGEQESECPACASEESKHQCAVESQQHSSRTLSESILAANLTCAGIAEGGCSYAPPRIGSPCASPAWSHVEHSDGTLRDQAALNTLYSQTCSDDADFSMWKDMAMPRFACTGEEPHLLRHGTPFLRSFVYYGAPVSPGESPRFWDDEDELAYLEEKHADDLYDIYLNAQDALRSATDDKVRAHMISGTTVTKEILTLLLNDGALAALSFVLVFVYMWFTVESFFIAAMGMLQVLLSFPPAALIWYFINSDGITSMQTLCLFMILGIGADDVFVMFDAWKQYCAAHADTGASRVAVFATAYRRALGAMAATTFTTAAAFFFGMFSRIDAIKNFCIFAAVVVVFDFLWCITLLAASVAFYERYVQGRRVCFGKNEAKPGECCQAGFCFGGVRLLWRKLLRTPAEKTTDERTLERFLAGPFFSALHRLSYVLLAFWGIVVVASIFGAAFGLQVASDPPDFGDQDVSFVRSVTLGNNYFSQPAGSQIHVFWGTADEVIEGWHSTNPPEPRPKWRPDFAEVAISTSGQQQILELCTAANDLGVRCEEERCLVKGSSRPCDRNEDIWEEHRIFIPADPLCNTGRYCFMEQVQEYADHHSDIGFPVPPEEFVATITSQGFADYMAQRDKLLRDGRHWDVQSYKEFTGVHLTQDNRLGFMHITFNATYPRRMSMDAANDLFDDWESLVNSYAGATHPAQVAEVYLFMVLQNELISAAVTGIVTALSVAFVCLVLVTFNWYLSLLGLLNITCILAVFLATIPIIGWELGVYECIFLIMTVGLSVDYTVHLLHAYNESHQETRAAKTRESLASMGITVLSGAITTLLASLPLFGCKLRFFQQYGVFIFFTILVSIILAIFLLPPLLIVAGPVKSFGALPSLSSVTSQVTGNKATGK
mmetsp:Transcript_34054/g.77651  ORF Transcript_34054/g.77651 Transcript_34054/m.77651 type:complete len:1269 (+) Transcript_34054:62-3868(+)